MLTEQARQLVLSHQGLAVSQARQLCRSPVIADDARQVALEALTKAATRFDPTFGVRFSTYATATIRGELLRFFRDSRPAVRVPRDIRQLAIESVDHLREGERSDAHRMAEAVYGSALWPVSLDDQTPRGQGSLSDRVGSADVMLDRAEQRQYLRPLLHRLPGRERHVVVLSVCCQCTQSEIGALLGISQMHVSRLLRRGLVHLRRMATAERSDIDDEAAIID